MEIRPQDDAVSEQGGPELKGIPQTKVPMGLNLQVPFKLNKQQNKNSNLPYSGTAHSY